MRLSLVDLSPVPGRDRHKAILNTLDMAQKAEEFGYSRIWLAEHHGTGSMAGRSPEVLIPFIAANTNTIKVGSGSVLLNHYSPFKVAEVFNTLEDMFPGRIDMGIGRATTGPVTDIALQRNRAYRQTSDDSGEQLAELEAWMNNSFDKSHPFSQVKMHNNGSLPQFWLLGSSPWSAGAAAQLGLRYSFAGFINPGQAYQITQSYKRDFKPSVHATGTGNPELILSLSIYCAETDEAAARMAAPVQLMMKRLMAGDIQSPMEDEDNAIRILGGLPQPEQLTDPCFPPRMLVGTPDKVAGWLKEIGHTFGTDEIMVQCITANHETRVWSHKLLAEAVLG